ncbi:hypothetical protein KFK09_019120 [Dendrobium nobile]|uniref:Uncharacterized protein n=1 Tax=Dendrobium nobile TaxID=94219 RepID=A0A8T3AZ25_DENNO|nr:hypothetical protein KFK09_019120 [Dendrobium nobile]
MVVIIVIYQEFEDIDWYEIFCFDCTLLFFDSQVLFLCMPRPSGNHFWASSFSFL